jgi:hypothetical protein
MNNYHWPFCALVKFKFNYHCYCFGFALKSAGCLKVSGGNLKNKDRAKVQRKRKEQFHLKWGFNDGDGAIFGASFHYQITIKIGNNVLLVGFVFHFNENGSLFLYLLSADKRRLDGL